MNGPISPHFISSQEIESVDTDDYLGPYRNRKESDTVLTCQDNVSQFTKSQRETILKLSTEKILI